jgi:hypothetical protein
MSDQHKRIPQSFFFGLVLCLLVTVACAEKRVETFPPSTIGLTPTVQPLNVASLPTATATLPLVKPTPTPGTLHLPCASFSACGFPDDSTTGVPAGTKLTLYTGEHTIRQNNLTINGAEIKGGLDLYANNVTLLNSRITSDDWWGVLLREGYGNLKILHCTFVGVTTKQMGEYAVANQSEGALEIGFSNFSGWQDAIDTSVGYIHDNYVHDVSYVPGAHTNAFLSEGGSASSSLRLIHNTLLNFDRQGASGALSLFHDFDPINHVTIENNWLAGGNYALYGGTDTAHNVQVRKNVFGITPYPLCGWYGPVAHWNGKNAGNVFEGNLYSNGKPVSPD